MQSSRAGTDAAAPAASELEARRERWREAQRRHRKMKRLALCRFQSALPRDALAGLFARDLVSDAALHDEGPRGADLAMLLLAVIEACEERIFSAAQLQFLQRFVRARHADEIDMSSDDRPPSAPC